MSFIKVFFGGFTICTAVVYVENMKSTGCGMFTCPDDNDNALLTRSTLCLASAACDSLVWPVRLPVSVMDTYDKYKK